MRSGKIISLLGLLIVLLLPIKASLQQPFDLDTSFRTEINTWYVNSIMPLPDGKVLISGMINFPDELPGVFRGSARLLFDGQRDMSFPNFPYTIGGGRIRSWNDQFYIGTSQTVRRLTSEGLIDPSFIEMNFGPYFSSLQGGDYHVYPDGRILMSGVHELHDSIRGFEGLYCLIWFTNEGYLDTTKTHRTCAGSLDYFQELPDGKFIGSGSTGLWDGQQASNIVRFNADGALDTTFQANVWWGQAYGFLPLEDGRVYVGGKFKMTGIEDTLQLVRLMPDGSLDPSFNNTVDFGIVAMTNQTTGLVRKIHPMENGRIVVTGNFETVEEQPRGCIALLDSAGNVLEDYFSSLGAGNFTYQGQTASVIGGLLPAPDGHWYIWGAYHGYNDGTTNDTLQRMVSRLYGSEVGVPEDQFDRVDLSAWPNPGNDELTISWNNSITVPSRIEIYSILGEIVQSEIVTTSPITLTTQDLPAACYSIHLTSGQDRSTVKWMKL